MNTATTVLLGFLAVMCLTLATIAVHAQAAAQSAF